MKKILPGILIFILGSIPLVSPILAISVFYQRVKSYAITIIPIIAIILFAVININWYFESEKLSDIEKSFTNDVKEAIYSLSFTTEKFLPPSTFESEIKKQLNNTINFSILNKKEQIKFSDISEVIFKKYETEFEYQKGKANYLDEERTFKINMYLLGYSSHPLKDFCQSYVKNYLQPSHFPYISSLMQNILLCLIMGVYYLFVVYLYFVSNKNTGDNYKIIKRMTRGIMGFFVGIIPGIHIVAIFAFYGLRAIFLILLILLIIAGIGLDLERDKLRDLDKNLKSDIETTIHSIPFSTYDYLTSTEFEAEIKENLSSIIKFGRLTDKEMTRFSHISEKLFEVYEKKFKEEKGKVTNYRGKKFNIESSSSEGEIKDFSENYVQTHLYYKHPYHLLKSLMILLWIIPGILLGLTFSSYTSKSSKESSKKRQKQSADYKVDNDLNKINSKNGNHSSIVVKCLGLLIGILPIIGIILTGRILIKRKKYKLLIIPISCFILTLWIFIYIGVSMFEKEKLKNKVENTIFSISFTTDELLRKKDFEDKLTQYLANIIDFTSLEIDEKEKFALFANSIRGNYEIEWENSKNKDEKEFLLPVIQRAKIREEMDEFSKTYVKGQVLNPILKNLFISIFIVVTLIMGIFSAYIFANYLPLKKQNMI